MGEDKVLCCLICLSFCKQASPLLRISRGWGALGCAAQASTTEGVHCFSNSIPKTAAQNWAPENARLRREVFLVLSQRRSRDKKSPCVPCSPDLIPSPYRILTLSPQAFPRLPPRENMLKELGSNSVTLPAKIPALSRRGRGSESDPCPWQEVVRFPSSPAPHARGRGRGRSGIAVLPRRAAPARAQRAPHLRGLPPGPALPPHPGELLAGTRAPPPERADPDCRSPPALRASASRSPRGRAAGGWAARLLGAPSPPRRGGRRDGEERVAAGLRRHRHSGAGSLRRSQHPPPRWSCNPHPPRGGPQRA